MSVIETQEEFAAADDDAGEEAERDFSPLYGSAVALLTSTFRRLLLSRKTLCLALLFSLPLLLLTIVRYDPHPGGWYAERPAGVIRRLEFAVYFFLIPNALLPIAALVYSSSLIQDEIEEQTLTYLLMRPIPRWTIYAAKVFAAWGVAALLAAAFSAATYVAMYYGRPEFGEAAAMTRIAKAAALYALAALGYCALFGLLGLVVKKTMVLGVIYIIMIEGVLAFIDFMIRYFTVMFYFRVLALRWIEVETPTWQINLDFVPWSGQCVAIVVGASAVLIAAASLIFSAREFRMKTPEAG